MTSDKSNSQPRVPPTHCNNRFSIHRPGWPRRRPLVKKLYKRRKQTVELGFADVKQHRALRRFPRRGLTRARTHMGLAVLVHNLLELVAVLAAKTPESLLTSAA